MVGQRFVFQYAKALAVGGSVDHTSRGITFGHLMPPLVDRVLPGAVHLVFPADDEGLGGSGRSSGSTLAAGFKTRRNSGVSLRIFPAAPGSCTTKKSQSAAA